MSPDLLSIRQTAERVGLSEPGLRKLIARGEFPLPVVRLGGRLKVGAKALDEWVAAATTNDGGTEK